jgi:hypothetical protein
MFRMAAVATVCVVMLQRSAGVCLQSQKVRFGPDLRFQVVILVEKRTAIITLVTRVVAFVHRSVCTVSAVF